MLKFDKHALLTWLLLCLTVVLWASAFVGIRAGLQGYTPGALALLRYAVASICMLVVFFCKKQRRRLQWHEVPIVIILGIVGFALYNITLNIGEVTVQAGIASFIVGLIPVFITLLAVLFLRERLSWPVWLGVFVSFLGIILIALTEPHAVAKASHSETSYGILLVLITAMCGAIYSVGQKPLLRKLSAIELNAYAMWAGTVAMLFYAPQLIREIPHASASATFAAIYMGIFPAAIAYVAWSFVLNNLPAAKAASFLYALPFVTILLGWSILNEQPTWLAIFGGLVSLIGAFIVNKNRIQQKPLHHKVDA